MIRTSSISRRIALAGILAAGALFTSVPDASADNPPKAEVLVIHGTDCPAPKVDPSIGEVPPLKHNCWALLDKKTLQLTQGAASTMVLANGRTFQIVYNGKTGDNVGPNRVALGCSPLFRESASVGWRFDEHWSLLATIEHLSNGGLCDQNRGLTNVGARVAYSF